MFGLKELRLIKPIGSVDNYYSGSGYKETRQEASVRIAQMIIDVVKRYGPISIEQIVSMCGASQAGTHNVLTKLKKEGKVTVTKDKEPGKYKKCSFYTLVDEKDWPVGHQAKLVRKDNSLGITGVCYNKARKRFNVRLGKSKIYRFKTLLDACCKRKSLELSVNCELIERGVMNG